MQPTPTPLEKNRSTFKVIVLLCAIVGIGYVPFLNCPLVFDSVERLRQEEMQQIEPPWIAATASSRSLVNLTLALNYQLGGLVPWHYRAVNIAIHMANAVLLFLLVRSTLRLTVPLAEGTLVGIPAATNGNPQPIPERLRANAAGVAFAVALVWAVHPLQTQAVTYVIQRYESLMALLFLAVMYLFLRGTQSARRYPWYIASIIVCFLGMATKPVMVAAAPVVLLFDYTFIAADFKQLLRRRWWVHGLLLLTSLWGVYLVRGALNPAKEVGAIGLGLAVVTPWEYFRTQPEVILHYLRISFWPDTLNLDYMWPVETSFVWIAISGGIILLLLFASLAGLARKSSFAFLILSIFLILAPTSSIVPIRDLAVEHRMYLPLAFLVSGVVVLCFLAIDRLGLAAASKRRLGVGLLVLVAAALFVRTFLRNRDYADPIQLWTKSLADAPHNFRAHHLLGDLWRDRGDMQQAKEHFQQATRLGPTYAPGFQGYASVLAAVGEKELADENFRQAVEIRPNYALAYDNWGNMHARDGNLDEALQKYRQAMQVDPNFASSHMHIGLVEHQRGNLLAARDSLQRALQLDGELAPARFRLAEILASAPQEDLRDGPRAVALAEELAAATQRSDPAILDVLAMAYAETGDFNKARETAQLAHQLALAYDDKNLRNAIAQRRELYRANKPYRMPKPPGSTSLRSSDL